MILNLLFYALLIAVGLEGRDLGSNVPPPVIAAAKKRGDALRNGFEASYVYRTEATPEFLSAYRTDIKSRISITDLAKSFNYETHDSYWEDGNGRKELHVLKDEATEPSGKRQNIYLWDGSQQWIVARDPKPTRLVADRVSLEKQQSSMFDSVHIRRILGLTSSAGKTIDRALASSVAEVIGSTSGKDISVMIPNETTP